MQGCRWNGRTFERKVDLLLDAVLSLRARGAYFYTLPDLALLLDLFAACTRCLLHICSPEGCTASVGECEQNPGHWDHLQ